MRLTAFTNYALRTLMFAALRDGTLSQVDEVARAHGIPRTHVVKCVHQLGRWGFLENVRGRGGGFRLARPAAGITVGEVVRLTEDSLVLVECFDPQLPLDLSELQGLQGTLSHVNAPDGTDLCHRRSLSRPRLVLCARAPCPGRPWAPLGPCL